MSSQIETPPPPAPQSPNDRSRPRGGLVRLARRHPPNLSAMGRFFAGYAWLIVKNLIGWTFIIASPFLGFTFPGPAGIPVFFIGFALITFPGKRRLTTRVLRGRPMDLEARLFFFLEIIVALLLPTVVLWPLAVKFWKELKSYSLTTTWHVAVVLCAVATTWVLVRFGLRGTNVLIRLMPRGRRRIRPWLRRQGILLLPPRHGARQGKLPGDTSALGTTAFDPDLPDAPAQELAERAAVNDEIIDIHPRHRENARQLWRRSKPWLRRMLGVVVTIWIFWIMVRPLHDKWPIVREQIARTDWKRFGAACVMFSVFLVCFRALTWRRVLKGFGHKLPYAAAIRIWSTSELARYLPGGIWQVVGRVYLIRPYGVNALICSTSQVLELCIFLFANVLLASVCLLWFGAKIDPKAQRWLRAAMVMVPMLAVLLHPKIFYGILNAVLVRLGQGPIVKRLRGGKLVKLLVWVMIGLVWQSLAVFLIAQEPLRLKIDWWWMAAGAYCLAWTAGFVAFWAPGGFPVRELVFALAMRVIVPEHVWRQYYPDSTSFEAMLFVLGFLLRAWTILGELTVWAISTLIDYRGALNRPDARGRIPVGS